MRIGELASRTGVPAKTIRYWETEGILPAPRRTTAGYRDYDLDASERLAFVRQAQSAGFTLSHIRTILDLRDRGEPPCSHVRDLVEHRLTEVDQRIRELRATRRHLLELARRADNLDPADCHGICAIVRP